MRFSHQTEQRVPYPVHQVFAFFANPDNLPLLMPPWQQARLEERTIIAPPPRPEYSSGLEPTAAGAGSRVTLSFRPFPHAPFRFRWRAEITQFEWNEHFCDIQISGPFAYWNHCHYIRPVTHVGVRSTLVADDLEYELPFGLAGRLAHGLFLRRQIERTFAYRQNQLVRILAQVTSEPQLH